MRTCSVNHVLWADCQGSVVHGGEGVESSSFAAVDSKEVYEPAVRVQQENVAPNYYTSPYSDEWKEYPSNQPEDDIIVVPKIFQHVFVELSGCVNDERHFAGMAPPTNRQYDLSKEQGLLTVDNGATMTLTKSLNLYSI